MSSARLGALKTHTRDELPPAIKSMQDGWLVTLQSSAVASALFAGIESQLLGFVKGEIQDVANFQGQALLAFTYITLFLSVSATMTSLILTDEFGELPLRASRRPDSQRLNKATTFDEASHKLLSRFGGSAAWRWVMWHWLFTLILGYICFVVQIVLYVWLKEELAIRIVVLIIAIGTTIPIFDLFWPRQIEQEAQNEEKDVEGREGAAAPARSPISATSTSSSRTLLVTQPVY